MRALLVDDEQPARERLRQLLSGFEDVEILAEAQDGEQAIEKILELKPDVVFLDIQMPGCSGMDVAASLPSPRPKIIFCTAYEEYAVDAFELRAVDYLLKPVSRARLQKAIERVRTPGPEAGDDRIEGRVRGSEAYPTRFLAKRGIRYLVVPRQEVLFFASEGGLTKLQTATHHYWMQPTLDDLERGVDPTHFCRVSRSALVNLDIVREVVRLAGGHGEARLVNGTVLEVSRRRLKALMDRLAGM
jgi:two-component system LytT family response regulator